MSENKDELVRYRLAKTEESLKMAEFAMQNNFWNSSASELYYTCFYLITALFEKHNIKAHTHSGVNSLFGLHFIKEGKFDRKW